MRYTDVSHRTWAVPLRLVALLVSMIVFSPWAWAEEGTGEAPQATGTTAPETAPGEATGSAASEATDAEAGAPHADFVSTKNIEDKLREAKAPRKSVLDFGLQDALRRVDDRIYQKTHLRFAAIYTLLYQHAYGGDGPRDAAGGDFDLIGTWDAIRCGKRTTGALEVAFEGRHKIETDITPSALSRTIDSLWTTTSGFNQQDFSLIQAYWRQDLLRDRLHFRVGKLSASSTFFGNRINSSSLFFLNYAFSDNPAVFFPGNGLGLHVTWDLSPRWSITAGVQNANGIKTEIDPSTLRFGEYWSALQFTYRARIRGLGEGTYRVGGWYVTPREIGHTEAGAGGVLSIDQELGKHVIGFLRYERQGESLVSPDVRFKTLTATRSVVRGGIGVSGLIPGWPDDYIGVGLAWGDPADDRAKDSYVAEIFYRSQIERTTQLSLSLQSIQSSTVFDQVLVLSVRLRFQF